VHLGKLIGGIRISVCNDFHIDDVINCMCATSSTLAGKERSACLNLSLPRSGLWCHLPVVEGSTDWVFGLVSRMRRVGRPFPARCDGLDLIDKSGHARASRSVVQIMNCIRLNIDSKMLTRKKDPSKNVDVLRLSGG
jgi:hypothetical protein